MSNRSNSAVIISADDRLKRILLNNISETDKFKISLEDNIINLGARPKHEAYIYDVELSDNDLGSTFAAITNLKKIIHNKPLILIGKENALNSVLDNKKVAGMIAKTINKPIASGQLQLAINACLLKPNLQKQPLQQNNTPKQGRIVVAALSIAFILVCALTYVKTQGSVSNQIDLSLSVTNSSQSITVPDSVKPESDTDKIAQLNQLALLALKEGRLNDPINNNVVYYLNQIKATDPYNTTANQTHKKLFALLEASYLKHSARDDEQATKEALNKIIEFEPYNHKYAQLLRELKERIYLAKIRDVNSDT